MEYVLVFQFPGSLEQEENILLAMSTIPVADDHWGALATTTATRTSKK